MTSPEWFENLVTMLNQPLLVVGPSRLTLGKIVLVIGLLLLAWIVVRLAERGLAKLTRPGRRVTLSESAVYALSRIVRYSVWTAVVFSGLDELGINLSHLAIIGGAVGVGIGFGLQNIFSNFFSGLVLLLEQTLKVGDFVDLQSGVLGRVSEIGIRFTRITTNDSVDVIVPNSEFINGRVTNWTFSDRVRRIHVPFGVAYGSDKEKVREAGMAASCAVEGALIDEAHPADVWLTGFGDSSLDFELVVWVGPDLISAPGRTKARYLWALETELALRGLEIPFPQRDLHIRSGILKIETGSDRAATSDPFPAATTS